MKVAAIGDLHGNIPEEIPDVDLILIAGDLAGDGDAEDQIKYYDRLGDWISRCKGLGIRVRCVLGNHDSHAYRSRNVLEYAKKRCLLLHDETEHVLGKRIQGVSRVWPFDRYAVEGPDNPWKSIIEQNIDILLMHATPGGVGDGMNGHPGDQMLTHHLMSMDNPPRWIVCGHNHLTRGWWKIPGKPTKDSDVWIRIINATAGERNWRKRYGFWIFGIDDPMPGVNPHGVYDYQRVGIGSRRMEILPNGRIGIGAAACETHWRFADLPEPVLIISGHRSRGGDTMHLKPDGENWKGKWINHEKNDVILTRL